MKQHRWIMALAAVGLLLVALPVRAQVGNDGTKYTAATGQRMIVVLSDSTQKLVRGTSTGAMRVSEDDKDRDNWTLIGSFSDTLQTPIGFGQGATYAKLQWTAESTLVAPSYAYRRMWLALRVVQAGGDTTNKINLAVQVRAHTAAVADSDNTFAWYGWATTGASAVTVADSLGQFFRGTFPATAGNGNTANSSEKLFIFSPGLGYGGILSAGAIFSWPNGIWVPLIDQRGNWFGAPYVSIRVRALYGPNAVVKVICKLYGAS